MTWHLKDRELERKLVELYPSFLDDLKFGVMNKGNRHYVNVECTRVRGNGDIPNDTVSFWDDELEEIPDYNPKAWNEYPKVRPPYDVMMVIDVGNKTYGLIGFYRHSKEGDFWCYVDGSAVPTCLSEMIIRFRPLED